MVQRTYIQWLYVLGLLLLHIMCHLSSYLCYAHVLRKQYALHIQVQRKVKQFGRFCLHDALKLGNPGTAGPDIRCGSLSKNKVFNWLQGTLRVGYSRLEFFTYNSRDGRLWRISFSNENYDASHISLHMCPVCFGFQTWCPHVKIEGCITWLMLCLVVALSLIIHST